MKKLLALGFLCFPLLALSQKLENLKAVAQGDKIIVTYDISQSNAGDKFDIALYASHNNFSSPLQRVNGDVGRGQTPGKDKRIEVDAKNEIANYKGELSFEVRAEVVAMFALTTRMGSIKRGKEQSLDWRGGSKAQDVKIELLKAGVSEGIVGTIANNGNYRWSVPAKQKTGTDYQLRLINGREMITTEEFAIRHKVPTVVKIIPIAIVGVAIGLAGGSKSSSGSPAKDNALAMPPDLGLN